MNRETFISILTEGYHFKKMSIDKVRLLTKLLIQLINESEHEIWATLVQDVKSPDTEESTKILIEIDSFSLLYINICEDKLMFYLYDEDSVQIQIQRIAFAIGFMVECIEWLENSLTQDVVKDDPIHENELSFEHLYDEKPDDSLRNNIQSETYRVRGKSKLKTSLKHVKSYKKFEMQMFYTQNPQKIYPNF